jgi:5'-deoxynucleotidase
MNLEKKQISNIVSFFRIVCNLKKIKREGWIHKSKIDLPESVADHSYSMCTISMVLADILNLETEHIMKMANLHDLAESLVGDKMPDSISPEKKALVEGKAMKIILSKLPGPLREKYLNIWNEYVDNSTDSAKFVHNMDKVEMAVQAKEYEFDGYSKQSLQVFLKSANDYIAKSEPDIVFEILQKVNDNSK